jgi:hypothetical protein
MLFVRRSVVEAVEWREAGSDATECDDEVADGGIGGGDGGDGEMWRTYELSAWYEPLQMMCVMDVMKLELLLLMEEKGGSGSGCR